MRSWANGHDASSLRAIVEHRERLFRALKRDPGRSNYALALARLIDLDGASEPLRRVFEEAAARADVPGNRARLQIAIAQLDFEAGRLEPAKERLRQTIDLARCEALDEVATKARLCLARVLHLAGDDRGADTVFERAEHTLAKRGRDWPWLECAADLFRAGARLRLGHKLAARTSLESALQLALGHGGVIDASVAAGMLGNLEQDLGDLKAADAWYAIATRQARETGSRSVEAIFTGYRAWTLHEIGHAKRAVVLYRKAIRLADETAMPRFRAHFAALRSTLGVSVRNAMRRELDLAAALGELAATGDAERANALSVLRAIIEAERAAQERPKIAMARLVRAAGIVRRAKPTNDDGRIALRMARAAIEHALAQVNTDGAELVVTLTADAIRLRGRTVQIRQEAPRRVLWALTEAWVDARTVSDDELIAAAWPDERLIPRSATHRLHVAISTLRKAGLGDCLDREGGYRLRVESLALVDSSKPD